MNGKTTTLGHFGDHRPIKVIIRNAQRAMRCSQHNIQTQCGGPALMYRPTVHVSNRFFLFLQMFAAMVNIPAKD